MNRLQARLCTRARPATGFTSQPEPRSIGQVARGRQLLAGNFLLAGHLIEAPGQSPWEITPPSPEFEAELHGFDWLDDLAALGDGAARRAAQAWVAEWISRYGRGRGPGWTPDLAGRRLIAWINHALFLMSGQEQGASSAWFTSLGQQTIFLSRRWKAAAPGLPRFEALTGLVYSGLALSGMESYAPRASAALAAECGRMVDAEGGIAARNPEELLAVFGLLTWAAAALSEAGSQTPPQHLAAIERIAPTLRALRHADGSLARFHGGGRGAEGRLDHALAASGVKTTLSHGRAMGFARLSAGRTTVIVDAAPPPTTSPQAQASTLAFELTSNRRPLIVGCGAGGPFGPEWERAARATALHSTLSIEGFSSARLSDSAGRRGVLADGPRAVTLEWQSERFGTAALMSHDGYLRSHGLTHLRRLDLSADGRALLGEDTLAALAPADRARLAAVLAARKGRGIPYALRFHLHPDNDAEIGLGGTAVSIALRSGEIWVFRHDGHAELALEPSVYLERGRLVPRATQQIVLSAELGEQAGQASWSLAKAHETPLAIRDTLREDEFAPSETTPEEPS